jgi:long-chain acyl-CoA synthetase
MGAKVARDPPWWKSPAHAILGRMEPRVWHRSYDEGVPSSIDYAPLSLTQMLTRTARAFPDRPALVFGNARWTWWRLLEDVLDLAGGLDELRVGPGTTVAIQLPNVPQVVIAYYAALALGARVVLTNPLYTEGEVEHQWKDAGCSVAIVGNWIYDQRLAPQRARLPIRKYVVTGIGDCLGLPGRWLAPWKLCRADPPLDAAVRLGGNVTSFRRLMRKPQRLPMPRMVSLDDVAVLQYTGGTTGVSKAAMLTHRNLSVNVQQVDRCFVGLERGHEVVLCALPLFHVFGMTVAMNWAVLAGAKLALLPNPRDVAAVVRTIERERVTVFPGVPAMYNALNHHPGIERADVKCVKACLSGSAPIAPDVLERFEALTGARISEGFGMSETSPVTHVNPLRGKRKIGSVGLPLPDTDCRIVDAETGERVLAAGEAGELCVRGPQVMKGYWKRPDETALVLEDGWMHTGDLAVMDEEGYFKIVGRKKDMINVGGLKVFPDEVDAVLLAHADVLEAATIGVPHASRGESVKSFVVAKPGHTIDAATLTAYCGEHLAPYKVPREFETLSELPKSTVLKVLRRELRERELAKRAQA